MPPIRRDYEESRLEAQQLASAYERVVPVIKRPLGSHRTPPNGDGLLAGPEEARKVIAGAHQ